MSNNSIYILLPLHELKDFKDRKNAMSLTKHFQQTLRNLPSPYSMNTAGFFLYGKATGA
jgi:hypothetical protein